MAVKAPMKITKTKYERVGFKGDPSAKMEKMIGGRKKAVDYDGVKAAKHGSWTEIVFEDAGKIVRSRVKTKWFDEVINRPRSIFTKNATDLIKRAWEKDTAAGQMYADRRHVEGLYKMAKQEHPYSKETKMLREVLKKSDKEVSQFWDDWVKDHSDEEIQDYFENSDKVSSFDAFTL